MALHRRHQLYHTCSHCSATFCPALLQQIAAQLHVSEQASYGDTVKCSALHAPGTALFGDASSRQRCLGAGLQLRGARLHQLHVCCWCDALTVTRLTLQALELDPCMAMQCADEKYIDIVRVSQRMCVWSRQSRPVVCR